MQSNIQIRLNSNLPTLSDLKQQNEDLDKLGTSAEKVNKLSGKEQSPPVATKRPGSVPNDYASKQSRIENNQGRQAPTDVHSRLGPPLQNLSVPPPASQSTLAPLPLNQTNTLGPLTRIQPVLYPLTKSRSFLNILTLKSPGSSIRFTMHPCKPKSTGEL